jgi:hypothetical protein
LLTKCKHAIRNGRFRGSWFAPMVGNAQVRIGEGVDLFPTTEIFYNPQSASGSDSQ